jgi:hypothetical protein
MPGRDGPKLTDEALDQLARAWFAEVRAQHPEKPVSRPSGDATGDTGTDLLNWLIDASDGADAGDYGGD